MAIIVDKEQKRKSIALSCRELFVLQSISGVTISQIAKTAGVGKGTLYEYFKNKEEIVFELVDILLQEYSLSLKNKLDAELSVRNKVKKFAEFFYSSQNSELRTLYKEFISLSLSAPNDELLAFQSACFNNYYLWFAELFATGVKSGELREESLGLTKGVFVTAKGMFVSSCTTNVFLNLEQDLNEYIDNIFNIIEVKK
jgi:AcrR family transcriptional regulator